MYQNQLLKATMYFERALHENPRLAEAKMYVGWTRLLGGDGLGGLQALREAQALDGRRWEPFYWEGAALEEQQRWSEAATAYQRSLALKPDDLGAQVRYARCLVQAGQVQEAITLLETLRPHYPAYSPLYAELRSAYVKRGDLVSALAIDEYLLTMNPYRSTHWVDTIYLYAMRCDRERVTRLLHRFGQLHPSAAERLLRQLRYPKHQASDTSPSSRNMASESAL